MRHEVCCANNTIYTYVYANHLPFRATTTACVMLNTCGCLCVCVCVKDNPGGADDDESAVCECVPAAVCFVCSVQRKSEHRRASALVLLTVVRYFRVRDACARSSALY